MKQRIEFMAIPAVILAALSCESLAAEREGGITPYVGASYARIDINSDDFSDDSDNAYSIYLGLDMGPVLGAEVAYTDLGGVNNAFFSTNTEGVELAGLVHFVNTQHFDIYARGGVFFWDTDIDSALASSSNDGEELFWAVGSDIYLNDNLGIRIEYARYEYELEDDEVGVLAEGEDFNVNKVSAGMKFAF